jgi:hypothetical protein
VVRLCFFNRIAGETQSAEKFALLRIRQFQMCVCASVEGFAYVAGGVRGGFNLEPATSILLLELFTIP